MPMKLRKKLLENKNNAFKKENLVLPVSMENSKESALVEIKY